MKQCIIDFKVIVILHTMSTKLMVWFILVFAKEIYKMKKKRKHKWARKYGYMLTIL